MTSPLSALTTLGVGGTPRSLIRATTREALIAASLEAFDDERWLLVGGGSNLLVSDEPFDGTVVVVATEGIDERRDGDRVQLTVEAGHNWDALVAFAVSHGWAGIEALSGIPGTVGAAPIQNIGAYGQELAGSLEAVEFLDARSGAIDWIPVERLKLGYRTSAFKGDGEVPEPELTGTILRVQLTLHDTGGESLPIGFEQLATSLGVPLGARVAVSHVRARVLELRASKGMVLDGADLDSRSAGSFFMNPVVSARVAAALPADAPRWPLDPEEPDLVVPLGELANYAHALMAPSSTGERQFKLSAAWLIEHAGVPKGFRLGTSRAAVSSKHTLALTNRGGATAEEIAQLARFIQSRVQAEFGIWLAPEPRCIDVDLAP
ncbi:MAG TPA: UDP-N-acetylmuramate dehydrogenase [Microbacteriaceae bacterium]|nr:UDP-N-acetylmuramate dehydrogenase [Microbacteriaceae bacterium]